LKETFKSSPLESPQTRSKLFQNWQKSKETAHRKSIMSDRKISDWTWTATRKYSSWCVWASFVL